MTWQPRRRTKQVSRRTNNRAHFSHHSIFQQRDHKMISWVSSPRVSLTHAHRSIGYQNQTQSLWNCVFLSFRVPFLVFHSYIPSFHVPSSCSFLYSCVSMYLCSVWSSYFFLVPLFVYINVFVFGLVCLFLTISRNISRYSSVSQIPVSYPILE